MKSYNFDNLSIGIEIILLRNGIFQKGKHILKAGFFCLSTIIVWKFCVRFKTSSEGYLYNHVVK